MFSKPKPTDLKKISENSFNELIDSKIEENSNNIIKRNENSPPSLLSSDLFIKGNLTTTGDIQIEGEVEGNIKANLLTIGKYAKIKGEIISDELIVNGFISGTIRAKKVTLTSSAKVEGDIIHLSIAIETGAHFEGSIEKVVALAALMPIVAGIGGNSGNQTTTMIVRGLALGQVNFTNIKRLIYKELGVALLNGILWGSVLGLYAFMLYQNVYLGYVMTGAMVLNLLLSAIMGVIIPLLLRTSITSYIFV